MVLEHEASDHAPVRAPAVSEPSIAAASLEEGLTTRRLISNVLAPDGPPDGPRALMLRQAAVRHVQRTHGNRYTSHLILQRQVAPVARVPDQHAFAQLPEASTQQAIHNRLHPNAAVAPGGVPGARVPWNGASVGGVVSPVAATARLALKTAMMAALTAHLNRVMPAIRAAAGRRRLPMTSLEGAGRAAKQCVDAKFGSLTTAAAWTPGQATQHGAFQFQGSGPGQNLYDAYDPAQRATAGHAVNPPDLAGWMSETDNAARAAAATHNFDPHGSVEEENFLWNDIVTPFVASRDADLRLYDLYGFAISGTRIVIGSGVRGGMSDVGGPGGAPSPAERATKWGVWRTLVHEYIHTLEHPGCKSASQGNRIIMEGFCEMFAKDVLLDVLPGAGANVPLRTEIEGADYGAPPPGIVPTYDAGSYAFYVQQAEAIRDTDIGGRGGSNAVKAAFFQGHMEFLGLTPAGALTPSAAAGSHDLITVPAGITTLAALATALGVNETTIRRANPALPAAGPLPAQLHVPGCRYHIVVSVDMPSGVIGRRRGLVVETKQQIATQNGVAPGDLDRANPGLNWAGLNAGDRVLIPAHGWRVGVN